MEIPEIRTRARALVAQTPLPYCAGNAGHASSCSSTTRPSPQGVVDVIRITGYLVRKSDLAALGATGVARHGSDVLAADSVANSHATDRVAKKVISHEPAPRAAG